MEGRYEESLLYRMDPFTKLISVLSLGLSAALIPSLVYPYVLLMVLIFLSVKSNVHKKFLGFVMKFGIPIFIMLTFIQGFFSGKNETILFDLGFAQFGLEGFLEVIKLVGVILVFVGGFYLYTITTDNGKAVASFRRVGLSATPSYLILATLNVVPQMNDRIDTVRDAQMARGLHTDGTLIERFKAFIPLIGPVIMSSLVDVQERGITLEMRGFSAKDVKQTSYIEAKYTKEDKMIVFIIVALLILSFALYVLSLLNII